MSVLDDGIGFDMSRLPSRPTADGGYGLRSVRDDLAVIGGSMTVDTALGRGSVITLCVPRDAGSAAQTG